jgi:hypothetical protein
VTPAPLSAVRLSVTIESVEVSTKRTSITLDLRGSRQEFRSSGVPAFGRVDRDNYVLTWNTLRAEFHDGYIVAGSRLMLTASGIHRPARHFSYHVGEVVTLTVRRQQVAIKPLQSDIDREDVERAKNEPKPRRRGITVEGLDDALKNAEVRKS